MLAFSRMVYSFIRSAAGEGAAYGSGGVSCEGGGARNEGQKAGRLVGGSIPLWFKNATG